MLIIAVSGKMGCGKDYITSQYIIPYLERVLNKRCLHVCFADQLKVLAIIRGSVTYDNVFVKKTRESRKMLQTEGTQNARGNDPDIWVKYLDTWIEIYKNRNIDVFVISDLRFQNEFNWVRSCGGLVINIRSPERNKERLMQEANGDINVYISLRTHVSECELDKVEDDHYDLIMYNDQMNTLDTQTLYSLLQSYVNKNEEQC